MIAEKLQFLEERLRKEPCFDYPIQSRIHPLRTFAEGAFVKREDELGFGISGSKFRKYRTLICHLVKQGIQEAVIIGGAFSNHVLSITQLLIEKGIQPTLFLQGSPPNECKGNFFFTKLLVPDEAIHWVAKANIQEAAQEYVKTRTKALIIPEGAALFEAFLGSLTLPLDIIRNEKEAGISFDHLFIDAGTGYTAAALLLAFAFLEKKTVCHLLLVAGTPESFLATLKKLHAEFVTWLEKPCPFPENFRIIDGTLSPSFGSTNTKLFDFIRQIAKSEGFFLDPIYSAKLFYQAKEHVQGNSLIIHSGGALSLSGFQNSF